MRLSATAMLPALLRVGEHRSAPRPAAERSPARFGNLGYRRCVTEPHDAPTADRGRRLRSRPMSVVSWTVATGSAELIGTGGMATVHRALDTKLDRPVAVKLLRREVIADPDIAMRFRREALAATVLRHPNIVACLETGTRPRPALPRHGAHRGRGPRCPSSTAWAGSRRPRPPGSGSTSLGRSRVAHVRGIVHRDVKPGNILLARDGRAMVTDFGIARLAADTEGAVPGTTLGSVHYFSPEQATGSTTTPASDVYSLGLVLYESMTGRRAWSGESTASLAAARVGHAAPSPARRPAGHPRRARRGRPARARPGSGPPLSERQSPWRPRSSRLSRGPDPASATASLRHGDARGGGSRCDSRRTAAGVAAGPSAGPSRSLVAPSLRPAARAIARSPREPPARLAGHRRTAGGPRGRRRGRRRRPVRRRPARSRRPGQHRGREPDPARDADAVAETDRTPDADRRRPTPTPAPAKATAAPKTTPKPAAASGRPVRSRSSASPAASARGPTPRPPSSRPIRFTLGDGWSVANVERGPHRPLPATRGPHLRQRRSTRSTRTATHRRAPSSARAAGRDVHHAPTASPPASPTDRRVDKRTRDVVDLAADRSRPDRPVRPRPTRPSPRDRTGRRGSSSSTPQGRTALVIAIEPAAGRMLGRSVRRVVGSSTVLRFRWASQFAAIPSTRPGTSPIGAAACGGRSVWSAHPPDGIGDLAVARSSEGTLAVSP